MKYTINVMALLRAIWKNILTGGCYSFADAEIGVSMECRDKDGNLKFKDDAPKTRGWVKRRVYPTEMGLAMLLLWASLTLTCLWFVPQVGWAVPVIGRVTTAGLNALLDSTLKTGASSPTWYVGLAKQVASDGAVSSGSATFTSASGTFVSGDIGRSIIVQGAGASGADLNTTISAVASNTSITLGTNASTTVSGARYAFECRLADTSSSHTSFVESTSYSNSTRVAWTPGSVASGSVDNSGSVAAFSINASDYIFGAFLISNSTKGGTTGTLYGMGVNSSGIARQVANGDTLNVTVTCTATAT